MLPKRFCVDTMWNLSKARIGSSEITVTSGQRLVIFTVLHLLRFFFCVSCVFGCVLTGCWLTGEICRPRTTDGTTESPGSRLLAPSLAPGPSFFTISFLVGDPCSDSRCNFLPRILSANSDSISHFGPYSICTAYVLKFQLLADHGN